MRLEPPFKAYDVRGRVPGEFNADLACRIGAALVCFTGAGEVVLGRDARLSSPEIADAVADGVTRAGADVADLGLCGTEQVYLATGHLGCGAGVMVTASHNPADYNGLKLVREDARPISADTGLAEIARLAGSPPPRAARGRRRRAKVLGAWRRRVVGFVEDVPINPLKVVVNSGNGAAGPSVDKLSKHLPLEIVHVLAEPDGNFPNGVPNPLLEGTRSATSDAVLASKADFGVAFDGDFDRCAFFDERGEFVDPYYTVGMFASALLPVRPTDDRRVVHDPTLVWDTEEQVRSAGGRPIRNRAGHSYIKQRMRDEDALYGGESSAHHYFREFLYCDSGMIPWVLMAAILSAQGGGLAERTAERRRRYPASGEINLPVRENPAPLMQRLSETYSAQGALVDHIDGLSVDFPDWRFNLRPSNTEPLLRLNLETRADPQLLTEKITELRSAAT
ncbi:MAG: phosphomannomutase [Gammaproteobacteria bacterium]|nr:phosphomannomutase [Gammaproteobacteria bacterium]MXW45475.1 phosphomannomutase [Gammaproteobacteria bacterium]MYD01770.1 phosphomannomutase [Gammaproteobacteria bacterium]MYI25212.1 phosphomannomutase [Gammaproteobacteria bacterium]